MKKMIAVGPLGLALGLVTPGVLAQAPQGDMQKWEQFGEDPGPKRNALERANASTARHGKDGYQLVSAQWNRTYLFGCRRPAR